VASWPSWVKREQTNLPTRSPNLSDTSPRTQEAGAAQSTRANRAMRINVGSSGVSSRRGATSRRPEEPRIERLRAMEPDARGGRRAGTTGPCARSERGIPDNRGTSWSRDGEPVCLARRSTPILERTESRLGRDDGHGHGHPPGPGHFIPPAFEAYRAGIQDRHGPGNGATTIPGSSAQGPGPTPCPRQWPSCLPLASAAI
jgi:hypothetical protein